MLVPQKLVDYLATYQVQWTIIMPNNCPPENIEVPHTHSFYRITLDANLIQSDDLKSYADLDPQKNWGDQLPLAVGLSVYNNEVKAQKNLKLPYMKKKKLKGVAKIDLNPTDGVVKKTCKDTSHYTWWRTTSFDVNTANMI